MSHVNIEFDPKDKEQARALAAYFGILAGATVTEAVKGTQSEEKSKPVKKEEPVKKEKPKKEEPAKKEEPKQEQEPAKTEEPEKKEKETLSVDDIRSLVAEKAAAGFKEEMKAKLAEYDAPNVTKLDPEHYADFMEFLKTLK